MPEPTVLSAWGLPGLFLSTLLSGAVLPVPSDALLLALVALGQPAAPVVAVATAGSTLGASAVYWLGTRVDGGGGGRVGRFLRSRLGRDPAAADRARARLARHGAPALLLSWVPGLGDALVLAAGVVGVRTGPFLLYVVAGKGVRYAILVAITLGWIS